MQLKIKDLLKLDPEAVIEVGGGHTEYATTDVELVERDGVVVIQESSEIKPSNYEIHDLTTDLSVTYDKLVIFKSYRASIIDVRQILPAGFTGKVILDTMFATGNNSNRFLHLPVENGVADFQSVKEVHVFRDDPLRAFSNEQIAKDPAGMEAGVMTSVQCRLLEKGVSI